MKTLLFAVSLIACGLSAYSQIMVQGISPAPIATNYQFTWADPGGFDWSTPDFNTPGTFVQDTLMLVEDGTPGVNAQGYPVSQEGCNSLTNNLTGKIAVIYRNSCEFSLKALNAQNAGAVGVIIINTDDNLPNIGGGTYGLSVTIPVILINHTDGATLVDAMSNGDVVLFMGNKLQAFQNDLGSPKATALVSPYGGANYMQFDGFELGLKVYNYGQNNQTNVAVQAQINGPGGPVYDQTINIPTLNSGDSVSIFGGNPFAFPDFDLGGIGNYPLGTYTLTYTIGSSVTDDADFDNIITSQFEVQSFSISPAKVSSNGHPIANNYPSSFVSEYQSCTMVQESNASNLMAHGLYMVPHTDTSINTLVGTEIFANAYQWDDSWVDLDDPNYQFNPATSDAFQNLNLITFGTHYPASDNEVDQVAFIPFSSSFQLQDDVRYLFCLQTFDHIVSFGYDNNIDYTGNEAHYRQPVSPVHIDGNWYISGWLTQDAPAIAVRTFTCPTQTINASAITNTCGPSDGMIAITTTGFGNPTYLWSNGDTNDTINNLLPGTYTVTVTDTNGCSSSASFDVETQINIITSSNYETCETANDGVLEITSVNGGTAPYSYAWNTGDTTDIITGLDFGNYTVVVTDTLGCEAQHDAYVGLGSANFPINFQADITSGGTPLTVNFYNLTTPFNNYNYTWVYGDGTIEVSNANPVTHTYQAIGDWDVMLIAEDTASGCSDTLEISNYISSTVSINELSLDQTTHLYPNPNSGEFSIEFTESKEAHLSITNIDGQLVYEAQLNEAVNTIHLTDAPTGIYLVHITDEDSHIVRKIVLK